MKTPIKKQITLFAALTAAGVLGMASPALAGKVNRPAPKSSISLCEMIPDQGSGLPYCNPALSQLNFHHGKTSAYRIPRRGVPRHSTW